MPVRRPSLDRLGAFLAVAEAGGFTAAARRLGVGKNALSQQVAQLERELGTTLFLRTTRRVVPTDAGRRLYQACAAPLQQLDAAVAGFGDATSRPGGILRVTAPLDLSANLLGPALAAFSRLYPHLRIELVASNEVLDLVAERIDVALRAGWLRDSSQRAIRIGEFSQLLLAAPSYLRQVPAPAHPSELSRHDWISLTLLRNPLTWRFTSEDGSRCQVKVRPVLRTNSPEGVLGLLRGGGGVSVLPRYAAAGDLRNGHLRQLLPEWRLPRGGIYLTWPGARAASPNVRAFVDFMREHARHDRDWLGPG